nr:hypothetical protein [Tanacetum cinerariifolium]
IMRNKSDLDTLSMDDLYNNLKVYKSKIKSHSSPSSNSQNVAFVSSDNSRSTNETVNTAYSVIFASSKDQASTASYVDDVMFSFFYNQSNSPQLDNENLEQIDTDDLKEMDLKWQLAMLTMRVKRFIKKIGRKLELNGKETVGYDRTKVECYNCHRRDYFARECKVPRNQGNKNRDASTINVLVDTSTTNALVVQDGIGGYDWSFQAKKELTNFALMAYTSQGSSSSSSSDSKTGLRYDGQVNDSEVLNNVFDSYESDGDDNQVNDRFKKDNSIFKSKVSETITSIPKIEINASKTSKDSLEKPKIVRSSAPLIEEWESDSEDENVFKPKEDQEIFDSGCSRHMTGNKSYLTYYQEIDGGFGTYHICLILKSLMEDMLPLEEMLKKELDLNGCLDWNEIVANDEIQSKLILSRSKWIGLCFLGFGLTSAG